MSMRQQVMMGLLALSVIAVFGATAARDVTARVGQSNPSIWLDPNASDGLLASRLNLTNKAKSPLTN